MEIKISYPRKWNEEGVFYRQYVKVALTSKELDDVNDHIKSIIPAYRYEEKRHKFHAGINFSNITPTILFAGFFKFLFDRRFKQDRNTIFDICVR